MRILKEPNNVALKTAKPDSNAQPPFRIYTYCDDYKVKDGLLLFNFVTNEVLLLEKKDFSKESVPDYFDIPTLEHYCRDYLISHRFIVSESNYDFRDVEELRSIKKLLDQVNFHGFSSFTVLTTTDCNARCYYCYEKGIRKAVMDEKTANDTAYFILKNCRLTGKKDVKISWFGGEPLYNDKVIDLISSRLLDAGIDYSSSMISNGLLLDFEKCKKAVELWKLKEVQITLDGTEKEYNRTKAYIGGVENAYETVLTNIDNALNLGIRISLRLNVSEYNIEDMFRLADELSGRFVRKKPTVYGHILFQYDSGVYKYDKKLLVDKFQQLKEKLKALGLSFDSGDFNKDDFAEYGRFKTYQCMADNPHSVVVFPDGKLHSCNHLDKAYFWGSIYSDENKYDAHFLSDSADSTKSPIGYWSECDICDECRKCQLYPFCVKLLHCPNRTEYCNLELKERIMLKVDNAKQHFIKEFTQ